MKKLLVLVFLLGSSLSYSAFARVEDGDDLSSIGKISLRVKKNISIKPNTSTTSIGDCFLKTTYSDVARVLSAKSTLKVSDVDWSEGTNGREWSILNIQNKKSISFLQCRGMNREMNVGEFKSTLSGYFEIIMPAVVEMD